MKAKTVKKTYSSGAWYFLAPAVIVLFCVGIFPLLFAVWNSLHQFILPKVHSHGSFLGVWPLFDAPFNWFGNYQALLTDESFREALGRTLFFLVINLPIQLVLGMAIALLLHRPGNELMKKIGRVALVVPLATTFAVVGLSGRLMFNLDFGVLNYFWSLIFAHKLDWLADPNLAFVSISIMEDWQWTPFCALILFSSLTMVPLEIEEAARLETEKWWHILWKVQLPFMLPGITVILILRTAGILKVFGVVYPMTRGGPGSATELLGVEIERVGVGVFDQGMAPAKAVVLLIIATILSRLYVKYVYKEI